VNAPKRRRPLAAIGLTAAALVLCPLAVAASQPSSGYLATPSGMAGTAQALKLSFPELGNTAVALTASAPGASLNLSATLDSKGQATVQWTPTTAGVWTIATSTNSVRTQIAVAPTPTMTSVHAPGQLQWGVPAATTLAVVKALAGEVPPQGSVTLRSPQGAILGTGFLQAATDPATAVAAISWTPDQVGPYSLTASYNPATPAMAASTSSIVQPQIVGGVPMVSYRFAPALRVGVISNVSAVLGPNVAPGSVGFLFDGIAPRGSVPTNSGVATTTWAPPTVGLHLLRAEFTGNNPGYSDVALQQIKVLPAAIPDSIEAVLGASRLQTQGPNALAIGATQELSGAAASGSPVIFAATGSCALAGPRLSALGAGTCIITARAFGGDGILPTQASYPVTTAAVTTSR